MQPGVQAAATPAWHATGANEVLQQLHTRPEGLADDDIAPRLSRHGPNRLPAPPGRSPLRRFLEQFNNALILFLIAAAVLAGLLGHHVDAAVIVAVVLVNALVGFVQEGKAEQALAALQAMLAPTARVLRGGHRQVVDVAGLVPGDIVLLEAGDRVPADLRLLHARGLLVDEAALTGESVAADKGEGVVAIDAPLGDRSCMAYSGTLVAAGQAQGVVVATGTATEIGRINTLIGSVDTLATPLLRQIDRFAGLFAICAIATAAVLFVFAVLARDYPWLDALMVVVALAVGVVPEGLLAVITITMSIGVRRMASRHAIVRRLPAVETLGATSVICSDKTGTLTRNEMAARHLVTSTATATARGDGYAPTGELQTDDGAEPDLGMRQLVLCGLLCNDAQLHPIEGGWRVDGDPMEGALLALAARAGIDAGMAVADRPRLDAIPFDASYRYMATLHRGAGGTVELYAKGAPEQLLALSSRQLGAGGEAMPLDRPYWEAAIAGAASRGERVLGFAMRRVDRAGGRLQQDDMAGLLFLGLVGFIDPPRAEAMAAVADCRSAGIAVKMITGDHAATAAAIARQLGLAEDPVVVEGRDLDAVDDADLPVLAAQADVFARASPEHKLRVVRALQSGGAVVAMTGDGVNDAPSLKQADVGIAMGRKGTEAAKEAAEIVLSDDNFASIVAAVHEGRTVYDNIRKVVAWTLPTNGGEALAIVVALLLGMTLPMTPVQILWINMVLTVTLGLALAFEPPEPGVMARRPRRADAALVSPFMLWRIVLVSLLFTAGAFGMFAWSLLVRGQDVATARTLVVNAICVMEIFYLFSVRYLHMTSFTLAGARGTPAVLWAVGVVVVAQLAFTYAPFMQRLFDTRPVALVDGLLVIAIGVLLMLVLETEKALMRRLGWFEELGGTPTRGRQA